MKLTAVLLAHVVSRTAAASHNVVARSFAKHSLLRSARHSHKHANLGDKRCPCIGIDNIEGEKIANVDGKEVSYPATVGSTCTAWDGDSHPDCQDDGAADWCEQKWCYVDPKHCEIPVMPKMSADFFPGAKYQSLPLYYSYATCGGKDFYTDVIPEYGSQGCRCIGMENAEGSIEMKYEGDEFKYPAEYGGQCKAWDSKVFPPCLDSPKPSYCSKKYCIVDPCSCDLEVPPKTFSASGMGTFQGRPVYWSYATCGETDTFSDKAQRVKSEKIINKICGTGDGVSDSSMVGHSSRHASFIGDKNCPCIGIDNIEGEKIARVDGKDASYPASVGSSCMAWDDDSHPKCKKDDAADWCTQKWCYVDPKHCDIPVMPKMSKDFFPDAKFQSLPLYYSYATCGGEDFYTDMIPEYGSAGCRCIGMENAEGSIEMEYKGDKFEYPAEYGGRCKRWDSSVFPPCLKSPKPDYCKKKYCLVDPCSCNLKVPPKTFSATGMGTFQGRPVYWSYATCGETDTFSDEAQRMKSEKLIQKVCSGNPDDAALDSDEGTAKVHSGAHIVKPIVVMMATLLAVMG